MPNLRAAQKRLTRDLLLDSARHEFQRVGYHATTIDDIVSGAGTTRTTFYAHFTSKVQLMGALIDQIDDVIITTDVPPLQQVVASGNRLLLRDWIERRFNQWPTIMPTVTAAEQAMGTEPEIGERVAAWEEAAISQMIAGMTDAATFPSAERALRASLAFTQLTALAHRWARRRWAGETERDMALEILTDLMHAQLTGAGTPKGTGSVTTDSDA